MLVNIMVATVAADPTFALKPRDHLVPIGFRLRHRTFQAQLYAHLRFLQPANTQLIAQRAARQAPRLVSLGRLAYCRSETLFPQLHTRDAGRS